MKVNGQLESATLEQLATDPIISTQGRVYDNTTTGKTMRDDGVNKRAMLRNDSKLIIGNDVTEANNVRIHKAGTGVLQDVPGNDATTEGASATNIAQRTTRAENLTSGTLPAAGNAGRHSYLTDEKTFAEDDGTAWRRHIAEYAVDDSTAGTTITLAPITSSLIRLTGSFSTLNQIPAGFPSQRVTLINRSGADVAISHENGATPANRIFTGTGANLTFKNNSSLALYYDGTTQRWQVVGEAAGAAASGGGVPNSSVITITADYTVLITDDVIIADTTNGPINATIPSASGNSGLRLLFEKIGTRQNNVLTIIGTVDGVTNEQIWALNTPYEIVSDGTGWKKVSPLAEEIFFESADPASFVSVVAVSTANIVLENMSVLNLTNLDNIRPNTNHRMILKNQNATEENGVYLMPATPIVISATAGSGENVDISLLANGSVVNATIVSTGQKVSLRFQTVTSENGIYVVGATPGTSVRDTSLRDPSYVTPQSLRDFVGHADVYNYPVASVSFAPTETSSSHTNDLKLWEQKNKNATTFSGLNFSIANNVYTVQIPACAKIGIVDYCGFGGAGGGGNTVQGGSGGGSAPSYRGFNFPVVPGTSLAVTLAIGSVGGTGKTGGPGQTVSGSSSQFAFPGKTITLANAGAGANGATGVAGIISMGGGIGQAGAAAALGVGGTNFDSASLAGGGGTRGGGGGATGLGRGGNGGAGAATAGFLGVAGGFGGKYGAGGGGGGSAPASGRPGRGGFGGPAYVKIKWG